MGILSMFPGGLANTSGQYAWAKFAEKPTLPIGFTPLESIALTGSNYFITDYQITTSIYSSLKVVADIAITGTSSNNYRIDGCGASSGHFYFGIASNGQYGYSVGSDATTGVTADTSRHTYTLDVPNKKYTVDSIVDVTTNPNTTQSIDKPFIIGGYFDTGNSDAYITHAETIWNYKFYENDVLVRNYIPCLDANGVACIYDAVNDNCIYASGSGSVDIGTAGNKVDPEEYVLGDDANAYPQDGYHADGYYYKKLYSDIPWDETGRYVWAKYESDPYDGVVLLLDGEYTDKSRTGFIVSSTGVTLNQTITRSDSPSFYFNGSSKLVVDYNSAIDFGTGDFTIDLWVYPTRNTANEYYLNGNGTSGQMFFGTNGSGYLGLGRSSVAWDTVTTTKLTVNTWQHVAVVRSSGTVYFFVNGSLVYSESNTISYSMQGKAFCIGSEGNDAYLNGYIDQYRISNVARWTNAFTPPTTHKLTEISSYVIGNEENAYPNDGYADDGYYYVKVGATKITPIYRDIKYASGTVTGSYPNTINITGLDFTPVAVGVAVTSSIPILGFGLSAGAFNVAYSGRNAAIATSFSASNGQFSITVTGGTAYTSSLTYYWWAIGY